MKGKVTVKISICCEEGEHKGKWQDKTLDGDWKWASSKQAPDGDWLYPHDAKKTKQALKGLVEAGKKGRPAVIIKQAEKLVSDAGCEDATWPDDWKPKAPTQQSTTPAPKK